jgi:hypothetical protein
MLGYEEVWEIAYAVEVGNAGWVVNGYPVYPH